MDGLNYFGCETPDYVGLVIPSAAKEADKLKEKLKEVGRKIRNMEISLLAGGGGGVVVGGGAGALLWKTHRIWGGLLGGLVVGPAVGLALGYGIMRATMKKEQSPVVADKGKK